MSGEEKVGSSGQCWPKKMLESRAILCKSIWHKSPGGRWGAVEQFGRKEMNGLCVFTVAGSILWLLLAGVGVVAAIPTELAPPRPEAEGEGLATQVLALLLRGCEHIARLPEPGLSELYEDETSTSSDLWMNKTSHVRVQCKAWNTETLL